MKLTSTATPRRKFEPREYQREAVNNFVPWYMHSPNPQALIALACGYGKTLAAAFCIEELQKMSPAARILWLIDRKELVTQTQKELAGYLDSPIGIEMSQSRAFDEPIVVASIASLHYDRLNEFSEHFQPDLVVVDEAHLGDGVARQLILAKLGGKTLYLTGTPTAGSAYRPLDFGEVLVRRTMDEGIRNKIVVPPVLIDQLGVDLSKARMYNGDYSEASLSKLLCQPGVLRRTADMIAANLNGHRSLIFASSMEHGQALAGQLYQRGIKVPQIYFDTPESQRRLIIDRFNAGEEQAIINNMILTKGFNSKGITQLFQLRPTKLPELLVQIISRGIRTDEASNKDHCRVFEIFNSATIDPKYLIQVPFERLEVEGVRQMKPVSQAAFVLSYMFNREELLKDPVATIRTKGSLVDAKKLHQVLNPVVGYDPTIADQEKTLLEAALAPPTDPEKDSSIKMLLAACRVKSLDEFLQRMDDQGWNYFPEAKIPVDDPAKLRANIAAIQVELSFAKRDYNVKTFLEDIEREKLLEPNGVSLREKLMGYHNRTNHWFRTGKASAAPYWLKPLSSQITAIRVDHQEPVFMVYDATSRVTRIPNREEREAIHYSYHIEETLVELDRETAEALGLPAKVAGELIKAGNVQAGALFKSRKTEIEEIHNYVQSYVSQQIQPSAFVL